VLEPLYAPNGADTAIPSMPKDAMKIWIVNNVDYAEPLENGWSKQAPQGVVRIAVAQLESEMDAIMKGLTGT
jgi:Zn ribbon nucleic-acid-binding protein